MAEKYVSGAKLLLFVPPPVEYMGIVAQDGGRGRRAYLMGLGGGEMAIDDLLAYADSHFVSTRRYAISALGRVALRIPVRREKVLGCLRKALQDEDEQVRGFARRALICLDAPTAMHAERCPTKSFPACQANVVPGSGSAGPSHKEILLAPNKYLKGEQLVAWTAKTTSPMLIRGGAGSGKTIVAMLRAVYARKIAQESLFGDGRVVFLTYDKLLNEEVKSALADQGIDVMTVDSWVYRFLSAVGEDLSRKLPGGSANRTFDKCLADARSQVFSSGDMRAVAKKNSRFYADEIAWIKGRGIETLNGYVSAERVGRGASARLGLNDRRAIWELKESFDKRCREEGVETFEDRVMRAWLAIRDGKSVPDSLTYGHVVVDEAQDFTYLKLRLVAEMAHGKTAEEKGITLVADTAQSIYLSGFSWKDADIAVKGRTRIFKKNYRNTRQIAEAAYSLIAHEQDLDGEMTNMDLPVREGEMPEVWICRQPGKTAMIQMLEQIRDRMPLLSGSRVVATYATADVKGLERYFLKSGFAVNTKDPIGRGSVSFDYANDQKMGIVHIRTLHHMKGLQFDHVFLWGMDAHLLCARADDPDGDTLMRKLVYVGMTRACESLTICCPWGPCKYVMEIDPKFVRKREF